MYSEISDHIDQTEIEFYDHSELPNILLWDDDDINFVLERLFYLHYDIDHETEGYAGSAALLAGALWNRETDKSGSERVHGVLNAIWLAADWMMNVGCPDKDDREAYEVLSQLWDATCSYQKSGFGFRRHDPVSNENIVLQPHGGHYELSVMRRVLDVSSGHPAHQHLAAALALLETQPLDRHRPHQVETAAQ